MSNTKKIRVLIVDDSVLFRSQIQLALKDCDEIEIVGVAANGRIALDKLLHLEVDLMTLDIEMPVLDGLGTVKELQTQKSNCKVILFSSMSLSGAEKTFEAMKFGALDFVAKPIPDESGIAPDKKIRNSLLPKILSLFPVARASRPAVAITTKTDSSLTNFRPNVLVIASSTGGPNALCALFENLQTPLPYPILIAQHMPPVFTASLAKRLGDISGKVSAEAVDGQILTDDQIYLAPGDFHMSLARTAGRISIKLDQNPQRNFVRPCADFLFESAAQIFGLNALGVVMTGMGRDGCEGSTQIKSRGGAILIQDEGSSVVFGMPGAVFQSGQFDFMGAPLELARKILNISKMNN